MNYGLIPERFNCIDLDDRHTWHRATLREWLDHRFHLLAKKARVSDDPGSGPLTQWETKYLYMTECLEEALVHYEQCVCRDTMGLLFDWIVSIEDELGIEKTRATRRRRLQDSVAQFSDRRLKSNRNPFYPRPPELIHIHQASLILITNMRRDYNVYITHGDPDPDVIVDKSMTFPDYVHTNPYKPILFTALRLG